MKKGRGSIIVNSDLRSRHRSNVVLESSPSAEIASYDYEEVLSEPELEGSRTKDVEVETSPIEVCDLEKEEITPRDLDIECSPETVCFSTDNQISVKWTSATELTTEIPSKKKISEQECAACKNIVNESGDEGGNVITSVPDAKESPKDPLLPVQSKVKNRVQVSSARRERNHKNVPKIKTSLKDLDRRKIASSLLLDGNKNSKIPRATTITCAAVRVYQTARIPSRGNSKTSLCSRSFFANQSKLTNFIPESNQAPVQIKTCEILERINGSTESIVEFKLKNPKTSRSSSRKEECVNVKASPRACKELAKAQVCSAGDHLSSPPLTKSILRNLRTNKTTRRSCNDRRETVNLKLSIHDVQDPWSDSKSSPELRSPDRWSKTRKMNPYIESTSEEIDLSSEYSSDSIRPRKKKNFVGKASSRNPISKSAGYTGNSPRLRPRRRARFSFFNTLFDIVFWPFLFLRTNR